MKTLKEIAEAIDALPVEAFKNTVCGRNSEIEHALIRGEKRWHDSIAYDIAQRQDEIARSRRSKREALLAAARAANVEKWIKDGTLKKGVFVKVKGARDGAGIREFFSHDYRAIHCRQWRPVSAWAMNKAASPDALRAQGYLKVGGMWISPEPQMTTHEFDKVMRIIS